MNRWGEYWRFTTLSAQKLFEEEFSSKNIGVQSHGNVLAATSFLHGLATNEIKQKKLDYNDPDYQLVITIKATKSHNTITSKSYDTTDKKSPSIP